MEYEPMAWDDEIVAIVRGLIQDYDDPVTGDSAVYTDDRLSTIILISGRYVQADIDLRNKYKINVSDGTLSPDPTGTLTRDDTFINLASLKASCILINAEIRQYTGQGISIRDGSSAVSLSRNPASLKLMQSVYCSEYEDSLYIYRMYGIDGSPLGEAVVGPVKAWYAGGGSTSDFDWGAYFGPERIGRMTGGGGWYGYGYGSNGSDPSRGAGGNWGN